MTWGDEEARRRIARAIRRDETSLWLPNLRLLEVPEEIRQIRNLRALHLGDNCIERLPDWLADLRLLETLDLRDNPLEEVPGWLGRLTRLKALALRYSRIDHLPPCVRELKELAQLDIGKTDLIELPDWIADLHNLRGLYIGGVLWESLPGWMIGMTRLTDLELSVSGLSTLPNWFARLTALRRVWLDRNRFSEVPEQLRELRQLRLLDIGDNRVRSLPDWIGQLSELHTIYADSNRISALPSSLARLPRLRALGVDNNRIRSSPSTLPRLSHLTRLRLGKNPLGHAPDWLGELARLRQLDLSQCKLSEVPDGIRGLRNLVELSIRDNSITEIPNWIGELKKLRKLTAGGNNFTSLPTTIGQLEKLTLLNLEKTRLADFPDPILDLPSLADLNVSDCDLTVLPQSPRKLVRLKRLDIGGNKLAELPEWVGHLGRLSSLNIFNNSISRLPEELANRRQLKTLHFTMNPIIELPAWIGQISGLRNLGIGSKQVTNLPDWVRSLTRLEYLWVACDKMTGLPEWLGDLHTIEVLNFFGSKVNHLPGSMRRLRRLALLFINENGLDELPDWVAQLPRLQTLEANGNQIDRLPEEIGRLLRLNNLYVARNQLNALPDSIGDLRSLADFNVAGNGITEIPESMGKLGQLRQLHLGSNRLAEVPESLRRLHGLNVLELQSNKISTLPDWLLDFPEATRLRLDDNPLTSPPPEIAASGTQSALDFLRECRNGSSQQWLSKLLVVGEGGVGKTSTIKNLIDEAFDPDEGTTHGMRTFDYFVPHPEDAEVRMQLRTWDFGGQEIYHATHQFFLTDRSLFLLLWHNRLGWEQGRLRYWLDIIAARAPHSPVLLVSTNAPVGGRPVDLPLDELRRDYPQIVDNVAIDNQTGDGIEALRSAIAAQAAGLPLMGVRWPTTWLNAADAVQALPEKYITPSQLWRTMAENGLLDATRQRYVADALHALGSILFHPDDPELRDTVILRPEWVNSYISRVLDSPEVEHRQGILRRDHLDRLWEDLGRGMRDHFLGMMEKYDLSYKTGSEHGEDLSLVVERLPWNPPAHFQERWAPVDSASGEKEIRLIYRLNTTPPGIPTWFIARSHRFTTDTHWRAGAVLAHPDGRHRALIRGDRHRNVVELTVRGPSPSNFFAVLNDGLGLTLARYPGLDITRLVPCQCSDRCTELFDYEDLQRRLERVPPRPEIECHKSGEDVHVPLLLLGLPPTERDEIRSALDRLAKGSTAVTDRLDELASDQQRMFLKLQQGIQSSLETKCPSIFAVTPIQRGKALGRDRYELHLYCEDPGSWHRLPDGRGVYGIAESPQWLRRMTPYLQTLLVVLKHAAPLAGPILGVAVEHLGGQLKADVELMSALVDEIPGVELARSDKESRERDFESGAARLPMEHGSNEADFRALERLLTEIDPERTWGGLSRVSTPEGLTLYLCEEHAAPYRRKR